MNFYYFLSNRLNQTRKNSFSHLVSIIAIVSVALGLAVMLVSFAVLQGFRKEIEEKIFSFGAHLQVTKYDVKNSFEENPISINRNIYKNALQNPSILHIQKYSLKAALLKSGEGVSGIVLKGIGSDFDTARFAKNMISGRLPQLNDTSYSKSIAISKIIADKMRLSLGDTVLIYFVQNPPRYRKLVVCGLYETSMEEFDELMAICDIRLNQKINNWADSLVGGYEIYVRDFAQLDTAASSVIDDLDYDMQLEKVTEKYIQIFDWLQLLDKNVIIFLSLILLVASFNIISTIFIMIMERTPMIGILKALGATNRQIQKLFLWQGVQIIVKGLFWGNIIGLGTCALQYYFKIIPLEPSTYYMSSAPIFWDWTIFIYLNLITFFIIGVVLLIPVLVISNIKPVKSIKWN